MKIVRLEDLKELPEIRELTPEVKAEILRLSKEAFTAADLQKFTEIDEGVLMEEFLAEMEHEHQINGK